MITRPFEFKDALKVDEIWRTHHKDNFGLPSLEHSIIQRVVEKSDGTIIAFGYAKLFAEAMLVLDLNEPRTKKVLALQALMLDAIQGCKERNLTQLHAVVNNNPSYANLLKKHYGFKDLEGQMLVMEL